MNRAFSSPDFSVGPWEAVSSTAVFSCGASILWPTRCRDALTYRQTHCTACKPEGTKIPSHLATLTLATNIGGRVGRVMRDLKMRRHRQPRLSLRQAGLAFEIADLLLVRSWADLRRAADVGSPRIRGRVKNMRR